MNTKNKILVVVDCQQDFFTGVLGNEYTKAIIPNVVNLTEEFINEGFPVIFTIDTHTKEGYSKSREGKYLPIPHCLVGTDGKKIIPELEEYTESPYCISLHKVDSFGFPNLLERLKDVTFNFNPYDEYEIHICGVVTNMCVLSVALNFQNLFTRSEIIIHSDACTSNDPEMHQKALDIMRGLQMQVV